MKFCLRTDAFSVIYLQPIADPGPWLGSHFTILIQKILLNCLNFLLDTLTVFLNNIYKLMNHISKLLIDALIELYEAGERITNMFRKPPKPSLTASNIFWCTNSEWMDRLVAYKQLELWTDR
jgi:hypothetical protein